MPVGTGGDFSDIKARIQQLKLDVDKHKVGQQLNACQHSLRGALSAQKQLDSLTFLQKQPLNHTGNEAARPSSRIGEQYQNGLSNGQYVRSYPTSMANSRPSSTETTRSIRSVDRKTSGQEVTSPRYHDNNGHFRHPMRLQLQEVKKNLERIGEELRSSRSSGGTIHKAEPPPPTNAKTQALPARVPNLELNKAAPQTGRNTTALLSARHSDRIKALEKQLSEIHTRLQKDTKVRKKVAASLNSNVVNRQENGNRTPDIDQNLQQKLQLQRSQQYVQQQQQLASGQQQFSKESSSHMQILNKAKDDQIQELQKRVSQLTCALQQERRSWEHKLSQIQSQEKQNREEQAKQLYSQIEQGKQQLWKERSAYEEICIELTKKEEQLRKYEKWSSEYLEGTNQQQEDLHRQVQSLKDQLHLIEADNTELKEQIQLRNLQLQNVRTQGSELQIQVAEKDRQISELNLQIVQGTTALRMSQSKEDVLQRLQAENEKMKEVQQLYHCQEQTIREQEREIHHLQEMIAQVKNQMLQHSNHTDMENARRQIQQQYEESEQQLRAEIETQANQINLLQQQNRALQAELTEANEHAQRKNLILETQLKEAIDKITLLKQCTSNEQTSNDKSSQLQIQNNQLRQQYSDMQSQFRDYEAIICEKDNEISQTRGELILLDTKCENLERDNQRLSSKVDEYAQKLRNRDTSKEDQLRKQISDLENQLEQKEDNTTQISSLQQQVKAKQEEIDSVQETHKELSYQYEALQISMEQDHSAWDRRISGLQTQNQQLQSQINSLQSKGSEKGEDQSKSITELREKLKQAEQELESYQNQYSDNLMYYEDQLLKLTEENKRLSAKCTQSGTGENMQQEGKKTNGKIMQSSFTFDMVQEEVQKYTNAMEEKDTRIEQLERQNLDAIQENQLLKGEKLQLQMSIDNWQDRYHRDLKQLKQVDQELKEVKSQLKETQQKLYLAEGHVAVNQQLNFQIEQMSTQLAQLREQLGNQQI